MKKYITLFLLSFLFIPVFSITEKQNEVKTGADQLDILLPLLNNKRVALIINQTSTLANGTHLLDTLLSKDVIITKIFAPEHGFRGDADAGETVVNGKDKKTGIEIFSLYGNRKKPSKEQLSDVDILIFDIQDVGTRFYTYISTMHYVMEASAENRKECIILDRPNPNDHIDGPILESKYKSFVGIHPIPVLHGLTVGELAQMINGERWLKNGIKCNLKIIPITGWKHGQPYSLPVKPSPNLPNDQSIKLYPSLCFFEATNISVGRGTLFPFQVVGFPNPKFGQFTFTPKPLPGFDKNPLQKNKLCYGFDLRTAKTDGRINLEYLIGFYKKSGQGALFFKSPNFMDNLAGTSTLREQILKGMNEKEIRESWKKGLDSYKTTRKKYLLYIDNTNQ